MKKQRKFVAAVVAINLLTSSALSPLIAMAQTEYADAENSVNQAVYEKSFYYYNVAYGKIMELPEGYERELLLNQLSTIADTVWTKDISDIVQSLHVIAREKSGREYDFLERKITDSTVKEIDKQYLLGELTSWGRQVVWTEDYKKAVASVIKVWIDKTETSAKEAEKAVSDIQVQINKEYLTELLYEAKVAVGLAPITLDGKYFDGLTDKVYTGEGKSINLDLSKDTFERTVTLKGNIKDLIINAPKANVILEDADISNVNIIDVAGNSLYLKGTTKVQSLIVNDKDDNSRVVLQGKATVASAEIKSGTKIEMATDNSNNTPFAKLVINTVQKKVVDLGGDFKDTIIQIEKPIELNVTNYVKKLDFGKESKDSVVNISAGAKVSQVNAETALKLQGGGRVESITGSARNQVIDNTTGGYTGGGGIYVPPADTTAPIITLIGESIQHIANGSSYIDQGATARDDKDGVITGKIVVTIKDEAGNIISAIDTKKAGTYTYYYDVKDTAGNKAVQVIRKVVVATAPSIADLNSGKNLHPYNYLISDEFAKGTYGSSDSAQPTIVNGDLEIKDKAADENRVITLQNINITGTLTLDYGDGTVKLINVNANKVVAANVGNHSLVISGDSSIASLIVEDSNNDARIFVEGNGTISEARIHSGAQLQVSMDATNANPFGNLILAPLEEKEISLSGDFNTVEVKAPAKINLAQNTNILNKMHVTAPIELTAPAGTTIEKLEIQPTSDTDIFALNANIKNLSVTSSVNLDIKGGNIALSSNIGEDVKITVAKDAVISVVKGNSNLKIEGEGTVAYREVNKEAELLAVRLKGVNKTTNILSNIPRNITIKDLINSISISEFAKADIIDGSGNTVNENTAVTESMKLRITAEDRTTIKILDLVLATVPALDANPLIEGGPLSSRTIFSTVKANKNGILYMVALAKGAKAPTSAQVKEGKDGSNNYTTSASQNVQGATASKVGIVVPLDAANYDLYFVLADEQGNIQTEPIKASATSPAASSDAKAIVQYNIKDKNYLPQFSGTKNEITLHVPYGTDLSKLAPVISLSTGAKISEPKVEAAGNTVSYIYTVTAQNQTTAIWTVKFIIDEPAKLDNIGIKYYPVKRVYTIGDQLDITGLVVTGTYSDGSVVVKQVSQANIKGFDSSSEASNQILTIELEGKTATYTITVNRLPITPPAPDYVTIDDTLNKVFGMKEGLEYKLNSAPYVPYDEAVFNQISFVGDHTLRVRVAAKGIDPAGPYSEFRFTATAVEKELQIAQEKAALLKKSNYTTESWALLVTALAMSETNDTEMVDKTKAINAAIEALVLVDENLAITVATKAVEKAERSKLQVDVDAARLLVNKLKSEDKILLTERLNAVELIIKEQEIYKQKLERAIAAVETAERTKSQAEVNTALSLIGFLNDKDKADLGARLDAVQKIIDAEAAYQVRLAEATTAVVKAENSKVQDDVDSARALVNGLREGDKAALGVRLDIVKAEIAVEKAETYRLQSYIDEAKALVNALPDSTQKSALLSRINSVVVSPTGDITAPSISVIFLQASKGNFEIRPNTAGFIDLSDLITTAEVAQVSSADVTLNTNIEGQNNDDTKYTVQGVLDFTGSESETLKKMGKIDGNLYKIQVALELGIGEVSKLTPEQFEKISGTTLTLTDYPGNSRTYTIIALTPSVRAAFSAVAKAEASKLQSDLDSAKTIVNALYEPYKTYLGERLNNLQIEINYQGQLAAAKTAVEKAEGSKLQTDVDLARELVNKLREGDKTSLNAKLDAVQAEIEYQKKLTTAKAAVEKAEDSLKQEDVDSARVLITGLREADKIALSGRLDKVQLKIHEQEYYQQRLTAAINAVVKAENSKAQGDINSAWVLLIPLKAEDKADLARRLEKLQREVDADNAYGKQLAAAVEAVSIAQKSMLQADVDSARTLVNALKESTEKASLITTLDNVQNEIHYAVKLNRAKAAVEKAEGSLKQEDVDSARMLVNDLRVSTEKAELTAMLDAVQRYIDSEKAYEVKLAEARTAVVKAVGSKSLLDVNIARTLVNALKPEHRTDLLAALDAVQKVIEYEARLIAVEGAVAKAENSRLQSDINAARALLGDLNPVDRSVFEERLNNIKVDTSKDFDGWIEKMITAIDLYGDRTGNFSIDRNGAGWAVKVTNSSLLNTPVSEMYTKIVDRIANGTLSFTEVKALMDQISLVTVNGANLNVYMAGKLQGKPHSQAVITFLLNYEVEANYNTLVTALSNNNTYAELVSVLKDMALLQGDKELPRPTINGMTLDSIYINNLYPSESGAKFLETGKRYSVNDIKAMVGVTTTGAITLGDFSGYHVGVKFVGGEGSARTYWMSLPGTGEEVQGITQVTVDADSITGRVKVTGNIKAGSGKNVTFKLVDPQGKINNLNQVQSGEAGKFSYDFTIAALMDGTYTLNIGGEGINKPYSTSFVIKDITKPVITVLGDPIAVVTSGTIYTDLGATALDERDGNITDKIVTIIRDGSGVLISAIDTKVAGTYTITYSAMDKAGNKAEAVRIVNVLGAPDTEKPVLTLNGQSNIEVEYGTIYVDEFAVAYDNKDGDLTRNIKMTIRDGSGSVIGVINNTTGSSIQINSISAEGTYFITYSVMDKAGNLSEDTRRVTIVPGLIHNVNIVANSSTGIVTVEGYTKAGSGKNVTFKLLDLQGEINNLNQVQSGAEGKFFYKFQIGKLVDGTYTLNIGGDGVSKPYSQSFIIKDIIKPEITMLGERTTVVTSGAVYTDLGATAWDDRDGDITKNIVTTLRDAADSIIQIINNTTGSSIQIVDTKVPGTYTITYTVSDKAGNKAEEIRRVIVAPSGEQTELNRLIREAEEDLSHAVVGTKPGQCTQVAKDGLIAAIGYARFVAGNANSTQGEIDIVISQLHRARHNFFASIVTELTSYETRVVTETSNFHRTIKIGIEGAGHFTSTLSPRDIILGEDFRSVTASAIYVDPVYSWQAYVTLSGNLVYEHGVGVIVVKPEGWNGPTEGRPLTVAIKVRSANDPADKRELNKLISDAEENLSHAVVGTKPGQCPQEAKDSLIAAISAAKSVSENPSAKQEEVETAINNLQFSRHNYFASVVTVLSSYDTRFVTESPNFNKTIDIGIVGSGAFKASLNPGDIILGEDFRNLTATIYRDPSRSWHAFITLTGNLAANTGIGTITLKPEGLDGPWNGRFFNVGIPVISDKEAELIDKANKLIKVQGEDRAVTDSKVMQMKNLIENPVNNFDLPEAYYALRDPDLRFRVAEFLVYVQENAYTSKAKIQEFINMGIDRGYLFVECEKFKGYASNYEITVDGTGKIDIYDLAIQFHQPLSQYTKFTLLETTNTAKSAIYVEQGKVYLDFSKLTTPHQSLNLEVNYKGYWSRTNLNLTISKKPSPSEQNLIDSINALKWKAGDSQETTNSKIASARSIIENQENGFVLAQAYKDLPSDYYKNKVSEHVVMDTNSYTSKDQLQYKVNTGIDFAYANIELNKIVTATTSGGIQVEVTTSSAIELIDITDQAIRYHEKLNSNYSVSVDGVNGSECLVIQNNRLLLDPKKLVNSNQRIRVRVFYEGTYSKGSIGFDLKLIIIIKTEN